MDQPYSPFADWLSKFYLASEPIQALWIVALSATVLGVTWIVMRGVGEIVGSWGGRPRGPEELNYGVCQNAEGRHGVIYLLRSQQNEVDRIDPQKLLRQSSGCGRSGESDAAPRDASGVRAVVFHTD